MSERYLLTQSLISARDYIYQAHEGYEDEAYASFLKTLNREKEEPTKAQLDGLAFEAEVYKAACGEPRTSHPKWESGIQAIAPLIRGGQIQVKAKRNIEVDGVAYLVYGKLDVLKCGVIYDIKYKEKSFGSLYLAGSYLNSPQHPMYFYICPEAYEFQYLVSDGNDLYVEKYRPGEVRPLEETIREFIRGLKDMGLHELYTERWAAK